MCQPATCSDCGRTTWKGCGQHVDQVMANVPAAKQCTCKDEPAKPAVKSGGLLGRLRGR